MREFPVLSESFILNQITGLLIQGHEVDIYATQQGDRTKVHPDVEKFKLLDRTRYVPAIPFNHLERLSKASGLFWSNFYRQPRPLLKSLNIFKYGKKAAALRLLFSVIPLLDEARYDIVHCQFGMLGLDALTLKELGAINGKIVTSFRGYDISWFVKEYGDRVYDPLFRSGDFFLANCEFFRQRAIQLGCNPQKIVVHGSGIDCDRFQYRPRSLDSNETIRIVTVGRLVEKKGIEYAIRAVAQVLKTYPNLEYSIAGDGELRASLQALIDSLCVGDRIHLLGRKNQPEIIEILNKAHLSIAPSVTAQDGNQDAPVNTLKEAMAMGIPVVATRHGGIPELVEEGVSGYLVPERDAGAIAEKIRELLEQSEQWPAMGRAGRDRVKACYDTRQLNHELIGIYHQLLDKSPPNSSTTQAAYSPNILGSSTSSI